METYKYVFSVGALIMAIEFFGWEKDVPDVPKNARRELEMTVFAWSAFILSECSYFNF